MTDYANLLERLAVSAGDQECLHADAKAAIEALQTRVAEAEDTNKALRVRLGSELERANELVADLQAECSELRGMAGAMDMLRSDMIDSGVIDINVPPMFFSESVIPRLLRLADMEKQEPEKCFERFAAIIEAAATEKANERANTSWALMCEKMVKAEREACLRCYSPGDTADDWADKIRSRGSDRMNEKDTAE